MNDVVVLDDNAEIGEIVCDTAEAVGLRSHYAADAEQMWEALTPGVRLLVMDLKMPGLSGDELIAMLGARGCSAGVVLMSGVGKAEMDAAVRAAKTAGLRVAGTLRKPFRVMELMEVLRAAQGSGPR